MTLLTPAERRTAGGIDTEDFDPPALIDALHTVMLVYEEDGLHAARDWLDRAGLRTTRGSATSSAARLRRFRALRSMESGFAQKPDTLEGLRATLFDDIPAPADPDAELLTEMQQQFALDA